MSLFQPTNISPDKLGTLGNGIADPSADLVIKWQVNGNTPMTKFKIDFYKNDATTTVQYTTGELTTGCPFYGTTATGERPRFSYTIANASFPWSTATSWKMVITQWWGSGTNDKVVQSSPSVFDAKSIPTLTLSGTYPLTVTTREHTFTATYSQANGDAMTWVRWILAENSDAGKEEPLYDNTVYGTAQLSMTYDGFMNGSSYAVKCIVETESGIQADTGWNVVNVNYSTTTLTGTVTATKAENGSSSVKVEWSGFRYIHGETEGSYEIVDGILYLNTEDDSIVWDKVNGSAMALATPWNILYKTKLLKESSNLLTIGQTGGDVALIYDKPNRQLLLKQGTTTLYTISAVNYSSDLSIILTASTMYVRIEYEGGGLYPDTTLYPLTTLYPRADTVETTTKNQYSITYTQSAITSVTVEGAQACDYIQVIEGTLSQTIIDAVYTNGGYVPEASTGTNFLADFLTGIDAGSLYAGGTAITGWAVYRQKTGETNQVHIVDTPMSTSVLYDYTACSRQGNYTYYVYPMGETTYITSAIVSNTINPSFQNWSIIECEDVDGHCEAIAEYLFSKNFSSSSMSNNNSPSILNNFTQFPTVQKSQSNYRSGTLESLIGKIKINANCNVEYYDTLDMRDALMELSTTTNRLFLKSRKGDLAEIHISGEISFETMDATMAQAITASVPWVEIGNATDVSIVSWVNVAPEVDDPSEQKTPGTCDCAYIRAVDAALIAML